MTALQNVLVIIVSVCVSDAVCCLFLQRSYLIINIKIILHAYHKKAQREREREMGREV